MQQLYKQPKQGLSASEVFVSLLPLILVVGIGLFFGIMSYRMITPENSENEFKFIVRTTVATTVSTEKGSKSNPIQLDAGFLIRQYDDNEIRANSIYKDNVLSVSGYVTEIMDTELGLSVYISDDKDGWMGVRCSLDESQRSRAMLLNKGDEVTITGVCDGFFVSIMIEDCMIE